MRPCHVVEIVTPKKYVLNGLWFGPKKASKVILYIHGLGGSTFSRVSLVAALVRKDTAVLTFSNRGHDRLSRLKRIGKLKPQVFPFGGEASEIFTDCEDDIQGAVNFSKRQGIREIYLAGHSTGCQKSAYWAYRKKGKGVRGIIMLAPLSDYAFALSSEGKKKLLRAQKVARDLIRHKSPHELLPSHVWPTAYDAQRFISLYSGEGPEEIFTYWDIQRNPKTLESVKTPILVLLAQRDEFSDIPAKRIGDWFAEHLKLEDQIVIVPKVGHSFKGGEKIVAAAIQTFIRNV